MRKKEEGKNRYNSQKSETLKALAKYVASSGNGNPSADAPAATFTLGELSKIYRKIWDPEYTFRCDHGQERAYCKYCDEEAVAKNKLIARRDTLRNILKSKL